LRAVLRKFAMWDGSKRHIRLCKGMPRRADDKAKAESGGNYDSVRLT
jgi:hypothetical protein